MKGGAAHRRELKHLIIQNLFERVLPGDIVEPMPETPIGGASVAWDWGRKNASSGADTIVRVQDSTGRARPHASEWCN